MKDEILQTALSQFLKFGIRGMSIKRLIEPLGISTKTVYKYYKNKEELLTEVLEHISNKAIEEVETVRKNHQCPIEIMFIFGTRIDDATSQEKNAFVLQLIKYYPEVFHQHQKSISIKIEEILKQNFERGVELGYYRTDIPTDLFIKFLTTLLFSVDVSPLFEDIKDKKYISTGIKFFYLNAIVTEKGQQRLKELKTKYEELD